MAGGPHHPVMSEPAPAGAMTRYDNMAIAPLSGTAPPSFASWTTSARESQQQLTPSIQVLRIFMDKSEPAMRAKTQFFDNAIKQYVFDAIERIFPVVGWGKIKEFFGQSVIIHQAQVQDSAEFGWGPGAGFELQSISASAEQGKVSITTEGNLLRTPEGHHIYLLQLADAVRAFVNHAYAKGLNTLVSTDFSQIEYPLAIDKWMEQDLGRKWQFISDMQYAMNRRSDGLALCIERAKIVGQQRTPPMSTNNLVFVIPSVMRDAVRANPPPDFPLVTVPDSEQKTVTAEIAKKSGSVTVVIESIVTPSKGIYQPLMGVSVHGEYYFVPAGTKTLVICDFTNRGSEGEIDVTEDDGNGNKVASLVDRIYFRNAMKVRSARGYLMEGYGLSMFTGQSPVEATANHDAATDVYNTFLTGYSGTVVHKPSGIVAMNNLFMESFLSGHDIDDATILVAHTSTSPDETKLLADAKNGSPIIGGAPVDKYSNFTRAHRLSDAATAVPLVTHTIDGDIKGGSGQVAAVLLRGTYYTIKVNDDKKLWAGMSPFSHIRPQLFCRDRLFSVPSPASVQQNQQAFTDAMMAQYK
jgi:hypothetical protein